MKDRLRYNLELFSDKNSNPLTRTEFIKHGDDETGEWLDEKLNRMNTDLSGAAQKSYVNEELAKKAKQSDLEITEAKAESASESVAGLETKTDSLQAQIDALVIEGGGDSNPEVVQARVDSAGVTHTTLKERIDSNVTDLKSDLNNYDKANTVVRNYNIYDTSFVIDGKWIQKTGDIVIESSSKMIYLPVVGGNTVSICYTGITATLYQDTIGGILYCDKNKKVISVENIGAHRNSEKYKDSSVATYVLPENVRYIGMTVKLSSSWDISENMIAIYADSFRDFTGIGKEIESWNGKEFCDKTARKTADSAIEAIEKTDADVDNYDRANTVVKNYNIYKTSDVVEGCWVTQDGTIQSELSSKMAYIPVVGGNTVSVCYTGYSNTLYSSTVGGILYCDKNKKVISIENIGAHRNSEKYKDSSVATYVLPENVRYIGMTVKLSSSWDVSSSLIAIYAKTFNEYTGAGNIIESWNGKTFCDNEAREGVQEISKIVASSSSQSYKSLAVPYTQKKLLNVDGSIDDYTGDSSWVVSDYIDIEGSPKIKISASSAWGKGVCAFYTSNKTTISVPLVAEGGSARTYFNDTLLDVPENAKYVVLSGSTTSSPQCSKVEYVFNSRGDSALYGKKVTVIGDSITEHNSTASKNWTTYLAEKTGCTVQNLGISGTGFYNSNPYKYRISQIDSDTDIIGVAVSFNDVGKGVNIGEPTDTEETTLCGYAYVFFTQLLEAFPATPIIAYCQCPWAAYHLGGQYSSGGTFTSKVKELCNKLGIPFYDEMYFNGSALRPWVEANQQKYYKNEITGNLDNTHPNSEGHKVIANYLIPKFEQNICNV